MSCTSDYAGVCPPGFANAADGGKTTDCCRLCGAPDPKAVPRSLCASKDLKQTVACPGTDCTQLARQFGGDGARVGVCVGGGNAPVVAPGCNFPTQCVLPAGGGATPVIGCAAGAVCRDDGFVCDADSAVCRWVGQGTPGSGPLAACQAKCTKAFACDPGAGCTAVSYGGTDRATCAAQCRWYFGADGACHATADATVEPDKPRFESKELCLQAHGGATQYVCDPTLGCTGNTGQGDDLPACQGKCRWLYDPVQHRCAASGDPTFLPGQPRFATQDECVAKGGPAAAAGGLSGGAIAGIVIGVVAFLAVLAWVVAWARRR